MTGAWLAPWQPSVPFKCFPLHFGLKFSRAHPFQGLFQPPRREWRAYQNIHDQHNDLSTLQKHNSRKSVLLNGRIFCTSTEIIIIFYSKKNQMTMEVVRVCTAMMNLLPWHAHYRNQCVLLWEAAAAPCFVFICIFAFFIYAANAPVI